MSSWWRPFIKKNKVKTFFQKDKVKTFFKNIKSRPFFKNIKWRPFFKNIKWPSIAFLWPYMGITNEKVFTLCFRKMSSLYVFVQAHWAAVMPVNGTLATAPGLRHFRLSMTLSSETWRTVLSVLFWALPLCSVLAVVTNPRFVFVAITKRTICLHLIW